MWPANVAPADVHIVATGKDAQVFDVAEELTAEVEKAGYTVLLDDRPKVSPGMKFGDAELLGMPTIVVVGRGLKDGVVELRDRATGETTNLPVDTAGQKIVDAIAQKLDAINNIELLEQ